MGLGRVEVESVGEGVNTISGRRRKSLPTSLASPGPSPGPRDWVRGG